MQKAVSIVVVQGKKAFLGTRLNPFDNYGKRCFPGGKVETGETPEEALIRELREELGILVKEPCLAPFTFASHTYGEFHLLMPLYICRRWDGNPQALTHAAIKWVRPRDLLANAALYPMPAADLPLIPMLRDLL